MEQIKIEENKKEIIRLLHSTNREGIDKLSEWLGNCDFFTAPASTRFHLNIKGGLAQHSLNVYNILKQILTLSNTNLSEPSIIICGLLHDTHKIDVYIPTKNGYAYQNDEDFTIDGEISVKFIQQFISLTEDEKLAIRWHNGLYDVSPVLYNKYDFSMKKYKIVWLLHCADMMTSQIIE